MKKFIVLLIISILIGITSYKYYSKQNNVYNVSLPVSYDLFEKDMFNVLQKLNENEKTLLLNYALRFKKSPSTVTVKEAIENEKLFEKSDEGIVFFSKLKESNEKEELTGKINSSAFITFVDSKVSENNIEIVFSIKNKTSKNITKITGLGNFIINNENFSTELEFSKILDGNSTNQIEKTFNFSEFPSMKEFNNTTEFKFNIESISFEDGSILKLN